MPAAVETTVSAGTPPAAAAQPQKQEAPPAAAQPNVADLQKQIDNLQAVADENKRAAEFWADKAKNAAPPAAAAKPEEDDVDLLEVLTTKGAKGLDEILAKRGYVRADEVNKTVNAKAEALQKEQKLLAEFPDLKNKNSDFFKATALAYGQLVKAGVSESVAMEIAAERTELQFMREGKTKTSAEQKAEKEKERRARVAAQAGEGTGSRPAAAADEEDEELTPEQKRIAASMGISEEAYAKRAKAGVAMKGIR